MTVLLGSSPKSMLRSVFRKQVKRTYQAALIGECQMGPSSHPSQLFSSLRDSVEIIDSPARSKSLAGTRYRH